jgi:hypothetical protein
MTNRTRIQRARRFDYREYIDSENLTRNAADYTRQLYDTYRHIHNCPNNRHYICTCGTSSALAKRTLTLLLTQQAGIYQTLTRNHFHQEAFRLSCSSFGIYRVIVDIPNNAFRYRDLNALSNIYDSWANCLFPLLLEVVGPHNQHSFIFDLDLVHRVIRNRLTEFRARPGRIQQPTTRQLQAIVPSAQELQNLSSVYNIPTYDIPLRNVLTHQQPFYPASAQEARGTATSQVTTPHTCSRPPTPRYP